MITTYTTHKMYESQTKQNKFDQVTSNKIVNMKGRGGSAPPDPHHTKEKNGKKVGTKGGT